MQGGQEAEVQVFGGSESKKLPRQVKSLKNELKSKGKKGRKPKFKSKIEEFPGYCYVQPFNEFLPMVKIKRIEPGDADKILGLKMAINGLFIQEYKRRKEDLDTLASTLDQKPFTRLEAYVLYSSRYLLAIRYFLHHTCF